MSDTITIQQLNTDFQQALENAKKQGNSLILKSEQVVDKETYSRILSIPEKADKAGPALNMQITLGSGGIFRRISSGASDAFTSLFDEEHNPTPIIGSLFFIEQIPLYHEKKEGSTPYSFRENVVAAYELLMRTSGEYQIIRLGLKA